MSALSTTLEPRPWNHLFCPLGTKLSFYTFSLIFDHFRSFSFIFIHFHSFSLIFIHFHSFSFISISAIMYEMKMYKNVWKWKFQVCSPGVKKRRKKDILISQYKDTQTISQQTKSKILFGCPITRRGKYFGETIQTIEEN